MQPKFIARVVCGDDPLEQVFVFGVKTSDGYGKWGKVHLYKIDCFRIAELIEKINQAEWIKLEEGVTPQPSVVLNYAT